MSSFYKLLSDRATEDMNALSETSDGCGARVGGRDVVIEVGAVTELLDTAFSNDSQLVRGRAMFDLVDVWHRSEADENTGMINLITNYVALRLTDKVHHKDDCVAILRIAAKAWMDGIAGIGIAIQAMEFGRKFLEQEGRKMWPWI